jgi:hypothetical protein
MKGLAGNKHHEEYSGTGFLEVPGLILHRIQEGV